MTTEILKDYIIYKIYCKNKEITDEYYGHTSAFRNRKYKHKGICNNENRLEYNQEKYKIIRSNGGWDNWTMSPIEEIKNCSLINARIREQYHIDLNKSEMNKNKAYTTEEENKEQQKERNRIYRKSNKEKIVERNRIYRKSNKEKIVEQQKEIYENNKEKIKEKSKNYYESNKEKLKEKMTCICGKTFKKYSKVLHERSQFHCKYI
jgi:hypothetical protein